MHLGTDVEIEIDGLGVLSKRYGRELHCATGSAFQAFCSASMPPCCVKV